MDEIKIIRANLLPKKETMQNQWDNQNEKECKIKMTEDDITCIK